MYCFQPGQKEICQRQKRPTKDFGFTSYFALMEQLAQLLAGGIGDDFEFI